MANPAAALPAETEAPKAPRDPKADALTAALEGMRQRLTTLDLSINDYGQTMARHPGMPPYELLQNKAQTVAKNVAAVAEHQAACHGIFTEAAVFPLPEFPDLGDGGNLLSELLRKKLDPGLEDWLEDAEQWANKWVGISSAGEEEGEEGGAGGKLISGKGWQELWLDAPGRVVNEASGNSRELGTVDYTREERESGIENVRTGLKRELREEPEIDDSDSEDEDMEDDGQEGEETEDRKNRALRKRQEKERIIQDAQTKHEPKALPMVNVLKFMSTGPPSKGVQAAPTASNGIAT